MKITARFAIFPLFGLVAAGFAAEDAGEPMALRLPERAVAAVGDAQARIYTAAQRQAHYLLGTVKPWKEDSALLLLTESRSGEHWIRPNAGAIEGFAFLYRFGPYDANVVGANRAELRAKTLVPMMRYLTATHVTGSRPTSDGKKWGDAWQSAHWAQMLGRGTWFAWPDLPGDVREAVRRVVAHETDRLVLNHVAGRRSWAAGEVISEFAAVVRNAAP